MTDFDEILISTPIDQMIQIIKDEGEVTSEYLSLKLKYPQETIEDWARYLEREGIIRISYSLNKMIIAWNTPTIEEHTKRQETIIQKQKTIEQEIIDTKRDIEVELVALYELLDAINNKIDSTKSDREKIKAFFEAFENFKEDLDKELKIINSEINEIGSELQDKIRELSSIQELINQISSSDPREIEAQIISNIKEKENLIMQKLQEIDVYIKSLVIFDEKSIQELKANIENINEYKKDLDKAREVLENLNNTISMYGNILDLLTDREKALSEMEQIEKEINSIQNSIRNLSGSIYDIQKTITENQAKVYDLEKRAAELNTKILTNMELLKNIEIDTTGLEEAKKYAAKIEKATEEIKNIDEIVSKSSVVLSNLQDIGKIKYNLEKYRKEVLIEIGRYTEMISDELNSLNTLLKIKQQLIEDLRKYNEDIKAYKEDLNKYNKLFEDTVSKYYQIKNEVIDQANDSAMKEAYYKITEMISLFDEIDKRLEDARKLVLELEDLKKEVNLISKQIELMKIRTPQNDKELKERLDNVSSKVDESKEKRRLLENLFQNILKKK